VGILIDTCIWIDVEQGALSPADIVAVTGSEPVFLSPVTIAELKFGAECAATPAIRQQRLAALARIRTKPILRIDETTGEIFGSLSAQLKMSGKTTRHRLQDIWLASQAIQQGFSLLTRNLSNFEDIPGLLVMSL
jgi:predicted nucleic acid-binding protein